MRCRPSPPPCRMLVRSPLPSIIEGSKFLLPSLPRPPRSPLFPYTTLFRSRLRRVQLFREEGDLRAHVGQDVRSEEHTSELQSLRHLVCRLLLEKKKDKQIPRDEFGGTGRGAAAHSGRQRALPGPQVSQHAR